MSVGFYKTGIVKGSGIIPNENLIIDSKSKDTSHLESGNEYMAINLGQSYMDIPNGTTVTISFDLELKYVTPSSQSQFLIYNTNNKGPKQIVNVQAMTQVFSGETVGSIIKKHIVIQTTINDRNDANKTDNYIEFYSNYNTGNVFKISNLKIELGDIATPYSFNHNDQGYIQSNPAFIEQGNMMSVYENHIYTKDFIEF